MPNDCFEPCSAFMIHSLSTLMDFDKDWHFFEGLKLNCLAQWAKILGEVSFWAVEQSYYCKNCYCSFLGCFCCSDRDCFGIWAGFGIDLESNFVVDCNQICCCTVVGKVDRNCWIWSCCFCHFGSFCCGLVLYFGGWNCFFSRMGIDCFGQSFDHNLVKVDWIGYCSCD